MTAHSNLTMIRCDGPSEFSSGCPITSYRVSSLTADDLRNELTQVGWEVRVSRFDLPDADLCPKCGEGTP